MAKARGRGRGKRKPVTHGQVVSELSFGFWRFLTSKPPHQPMEPRDVVEVAHHVTGLHLPVSPSDSPPL